MVLSVGRHDKEMWEYTGVLLANSVTQGRFITMVKGKVSQNYAKRIISEI